MQEPATRETNKKHAKSEKKRDSNSHNKTKEKPVNKTKIKTKHQKHSWQTRRKVDPNSLRWKQVAFEKVTSVYVFYFKKQKWRNIRAVKEGCGWATKQETMNIRLQDTVGGAALIVTPESVVDSRVCGVNAYSKKNPFVLKKLKKLFSGKLFHAVKKPYFGWMVSCAPLLLHWNRRGCDATAGPQHGYPELIPGKYFSAYYVPMWAEFISSRIFFSQGLQIAGDLRLADSSHMKKGKTNTKGGKVEEKNTTRMFSLQGFRKKSDDKKPQTPFFMCEKKNRKGWEPPPQQKKQEQVKDLEGNGFRGKQQPQNWRKSRPVV